MRDAGCSPLHQLLDDRASRAERVDPVAGDVRAVRRDSRGRYGARKIKAALERRGVTASGRRIGGIMREQGMTSAYARRRSEPHRTRADEAGPANLSDPRVRRLRPTHASGGRSYLCPRRRRLGVRVPAGRPGGQGHRRPFSRADPGRKPGWPRLYFVKLICTVSSFFLDGFVVHSGRFGLSGFLLVLFGYSISEWVFL